MRAVVVERLSNGLLNLFAGAVIVLMLAIALQVVCNRFDINPLLVFETPLAWLGPAVTLNSLLDLQWHLLAVVLLLPAGLVLLLDRHVRVDFLYANLSPTARRLVDLLGNALFAAPFIVLSVPASFAIVTRAWRVDEGSRNGGLTDLWLIKSVLPLGLLLLAVAVLVETVLLVRQLVRR
jgi:TRAP-type mannitol/chloroaromatic compound transport system permease small subunit